MGNVVVVVVGVVVVAAAAAVAVVAVGNAWATTRADGETVAASGDVDCLVTVKDCQNEEYSLAVLIKLRERMHAKYQSRSHLPPPQSLSLSLSLSLSVCVCVCVCQHHQQHQQQQHDAAGSRTCRSQRPSQRMRAVRRGWACSNAIHTRHGAASTSKPVSLPPLLLLLLPASRCLLPPHTSRRLCPCHHLARTHARAVRVCVCACTRATEGQRPRMRWADPCKSYPECVLLL